MEVITGGTTKVAPLALHSTVPLEEVPSYTTTELPNFKLTRFIIRLTGTFFPEDICQAQFMPRIITLVLWLPSAIIVLSSVITAG